MDPKKAKERRAHVARELGSLLRGEVRAKWSTVRTAERNERNHHVWRFRSLPDNSERFLRVSHAAMEQGEDPSQLLFEQLSSAGWLDRLHAGPETALLLSAKGRIEPWPASN